MTKLGLISDTHGTLSINVYDAFKDVDYIIHAGDIGSHSLLWELETIAPTFAVLGNNDWEIYGSAVTKVCEVELDGVKIYVTHFPQEAKRAASSGKYDLVVHGHTHIPCDEMIGDCRFINPGSASRPRGLSSAQVVLLELFDGATGPAQTYLL